MINKRFPIHFISLQIFFHFNSCKMSFDIELKSASSSDTKSQKLSEHTCQLIRQTNMFCEHRQFRRACANARQPYKGCPFTCNLAEITRNETVWRIRTNNVKGVYCFIGQNVISERFPTSLD